MRQQVLVGLFAVVMLVSMTMATRHEDDADWAIFKQRFQKKYNNRAEDIMRRHIRAQNLDRIKRHNAAAAAGKFTYTLAENALSDLTEDEYKQRLGYRPIQRDNQDRRSRRQVIYLPAMPIYSNTVDVSTLPATVNWTAQGWVGPIQNQGQCGSCWSYSSTGAMEGQYYNVTGQFVQQSQQDLIDCSTPQGNMGCNGGNMEAAFYYAQQNGIEPLSLYPDVSNITGVSNETCQANSALNIMTVNSWRSITQDSEDALQQAVALVGPVSVAIDASLMSFQLYSGGVYSSSLCTELNLDHGVLVVGYGVYNTVPYWLIKNSWGTSWGIQGYMMMARNDNNMCGIASEASFPVAGSTTTTIAK